MARQRDGVDGCTTRLAATARRFHDQLASATALRNQLCMTRLLPLLGVGLFALAYGQAPLSYSNQNQYFLHGRMMKHWGFDRLGHKIYEESIGEMKHAEKLIDRILFLEGVPEIARYDVIRVGSEVKEQLENDLVLERNGVSLYNDIVALCSQVKDNGTRELVATILVESEEHVDWLETQLGLIDQVGLQNYLQTQMAAADEEA